MPPAIPTVLLNSSPMTIVTLPVALVITLMFTAATSPTVMLSTVTIIVEGTLLTLIS